MIWDGSRVGEGGEGEAGETILRVSFPEHVSIPVEDDAIPGLSPYVSDGFSFLYRMNAF